MNNQKKLFLLLIIFLLCCFTFSIIQIYAKYLSTTNGDTSIKIANWNIVVNNLSIKSDTDISSAIIPIFPGNENISSNIIAPTSEGYFDLNFDFTNIDVSFKYEINVSASKNSSVTDLVATGYSVDDGEKITFSTFNEPISDTIVLNSNISNRKIRVFILWNDDDSTSTMSNEEDTIATNSDVPALLNVDISFIQIK